MLYKDDNLKKSIIECNFSGGYHASIFAQNVIYIDTLMRLLILGADCTRINFFGIDAYKNLKEYKNITEENINRFREHRNSIIDVLKNKS